MSLGVTGPLVGAALEDPRLRWPGIFPALGQTKLKLNPDKYRSASQGPLTQDERVINKYDRKDLEEIDAVIDQITRTHGWKPIIPQYYASRTWLWRQWHGTIVERLWPSVLISAALPGLIAVCTHFIDPSITWLGVPEGSHQLVAALSAVSNGWNYLLTLTTFVTTFFVSHAHDFWRTAYKLTRVVQGRMNDVAMLCATHAARGPQGAIDPAAKVLLKDLARQARLTHVLFWSDVCYRRVGDSASVHVLLSSAALERMEERGLLTEREHAALLYADLPPSRWYLVTMEWIGARIALARRQGLLVGGEGFEQTVLQKLCELRGACMGIPDELAARMPLAYVHFTNMLVDALLVIAPFALYSKLGAFAVLINGVIALFYRGLLELSKSFLDPFGNRRVSSTSLSADIRIDTLIGEINAGSIIWPKGVERLPFDTDAGEILLNELPQL